MPSTIDLEKKQLRGEVRRQLSAMEPQTLEAGDEALFEKFLAMPQVQKANTIFAFWGIAGKEPDTKKLIAKLVAQGKKIGLPRMLPEHQMEVRLYDPEKPLVPVGFGISEPGLDCPILEKKDIDLILVPAVCYDRQGYRLGFGGGYYDRWLEHFEGFRVGLCRQAVLQDKVPTEPHDSRVDVLITEEETFCFE